MSISLLLEMAASTQPERIAVVCGDTRLTTGELADLADRAASVIQGSGARHVAYVGVGGAHQPLLTFASARAAVPFTPINYRLSAAGIRELVDRLPDPLVIVDARYRQMVGDHPRVIVSDDFEAQARSAPVYDGFADPDSIAVVLFTSGTTSKPKAVELTHSNLTSYVLGTVEFDSAEPDDAALICVPPYHIAGVNAALSNVYAGRTMVYLPIFDADEWIRLAVDAKVTTATVVPTMLDRLVSSLEQSGARLPSLRNLAYGGSRVPLPLIRRALELLPEVGFVNAYGLTETSSTIAVLTPEDHRTAHRAVLPKEARRLGSVGRPVPGVEVQIRDENGDVLAHDQQGEAYVRGEQVAGRYAGVGSVLDSEGWFPTKDFATIDEDGYLYIIGRSDDTIVRGGENIAPAEVEDVLVEHPDVREVAVVGVDDKQWGQAIVAVVVPSEGSTPSAAALREYVRAALRGSRTPDRIIFRAALPVTATGKLLRNEIIASLCI